jgi:hypothetical protein
LLAVFSVNLLASTNAQFICSNSNVYLYIAMSI